MRPGTGVAAVVGSGAGGLGAGGWGTASGGGVTAVGGGAGAPQAVRASRGKAASRTLAGSGLPGIPRASPRKLCSDLAITALHQVTKTIQIGLEFPGDDATKNAGLHQRCHDAG